MRTRPWARPPKIAGTEGGHGKGCLRMIPPSKLINFGLNLCPKWSSLFEITSIYLSQEQMLTNFAVVSTIFVIMTTKFWLWRHFLSWKQICCCDHMTKWMVCSHFKSSWHICYQKQKPSFEKFMPTKLPFVAPSSLGRVRRKLWRRRAAMGLHPPCGSLDAKKIFFFEIHNTDRSIKMCYFSSSGLTTMTTTS